MQQLNIAWEPRRFTEMATSTVDQTSLKVCMLQLLREHAERVVSLVKAPGIDRYYGTNTHGRNCLTFPGEMHHAGGNRCMVWLTEGNIWYRCLDPDHRAKQTCLGPLE